MPNKVNTFSIRNRMRCEAFIYLDLFAQSEGFDLQQAVTDVFEAKSKEIGYAE